MHLLSEADVERFLDWETAIEAIEKTLAVASTALTDNFPVVRTKLRDGGSLFGIKSGCNYSERQLGLKAGGYWSGNAERGLDRHQSTVLLLDVDTGRPLGLVAGNNLTAIRTAAASAVSVKHLATQNASVLAIIGVGRQALFQVKAVSAVRPVREVRAWGPTPSRVEAFGREVRGLGLNFVAASTRAEAASVADIVVTVTPSREPVLTGADVKPGVHICAMGSDTVGKRELSLDLLEGARVFADDIVQASTIGECQHLVGESAAKLKDVHPIGDLILGRVPGRRDENEVTIFDGTGLALQDLAAAHVVLERVLAAGTARLISM